MPNRSDAVLRVEVPLPFRPRSVNAFLVPLDGGGWMLVDGGFDTDEAWAVLTSAVERVASWADLRLHVVTHMHMDHLGLVHRVRARVRAPVAMGELDGVRAAHAAADPVEERDYRVGLLAANGAPESLVEAERVGGIGSRPPPFVAPDHHLPSAVAPLPGAPEWVSVWTPGHTAGHVSLYRARDRVLIAGDAVIPRVTPTIGVNRQRADPVGDYLDSLERLRDLGPALIHGGHGAPLEGTARIEELGRELLAESERIGELLGAEPATAWEIAGRRYADRELPPMMRLLALRETLAHLDRLAAHGRAIRQERGGIVGFAAAGQRGNE